MWHGRRRAPACVFHARIQLIRCWYGGTECGFRTGAGQCAFILRACRKVQYCLSLDSFHRWSSHVLFEHGCKLLLGIHFKSGFVTKPSCRTQCSAIPLQNCVVLTKRDGIYGSRMTSPPLFLIYFFPLSHAAGDTINRSVKT